MANVFRRRRAINTCWWEKGLGEGCLLHVLPCVDLFTLNFGGARFIEGWSRSWNVAELLACGVGVWLVGADGSLLLQHLLCGLSNLVDPASSHMLVSKIKPCMSQCKFLYGRTVNGSLKQL